MPFALAALSFRLSCPEVICRPGSRVVVLTPVHSSDPDDPNKTFSKFNPNAEFKFTITQEEAFDLLQPDAIYDLILVPATGDFDIKLVPKVLTIAPIGTAPGTAGAPAGDPALIDAAVATAAMGAGPDLATVAAAAAETDASAAALPVVASAPIAVAPAAVVDASAAAVVPVVDPSAVVDASGTTAVPAATASAATGA